MCHRKGSAQAPRALDIRGKWNGLVLTSETSIWSCASPPSLVPSSKNLQDSVVDLQSDLAHFEYCPLTLWTQAFIMAAEQRKLLEQLMGGKFSRYSPAMQP